MDNILKVMDLSNAHLPLSVYSRMESGTEETVSMHGAYGFLVNTNQFKPKSASPELNACIEFARSQDCQYILFDADGETIEELPVYDW